MNDMLLVALLTSAAAVSPAQSWTPAQQEIIEQIRRCNDAWTASIAKKQFELYDSVCPATDQAVFWYTTNEAPAAYKGPNGVWAQSAAQIRAATWRDLQPVAVQVDGDVAYIYYSVTWIPEPNAAPTVQHPTRRLTIFQRRNGRWLMSGGSIARVVK